MKPISIVWFRNDLRLQDNPALSLACAESSALLPVFILDPDAGGAWPPGGATKWWLHQSLKELSGAIKHSGGVLHIRSGDSLKVLRECIAQSGASQIYWNRRYDPFGRAQDAEIEEALSSKGIEVKTFNASLLHEPEKVLTQQGNPFKVFTPFWKQCAATIRFEELYEAPKKITSVKGIDSLALDALELEPKINWAEGFWELWKPGEDGAHEHLEKFCDGVIERYQVGRDFPAENDVSLLSPHLHFGEISPRQIWMAVLKASKGASKTSKLKMSADTYLKELGWREFAHHVLYHFPQTADKPLREQFKDFPWTRNAQHMKKWQKGQTGYPIVDAGMRQLWHTGWMHNRVRMIVASLLTKHLLLSWHAGAKWFWDTLVDADLPNNTLGWQWASGCGADAAPYFRIFNPELQGEKFDPDGEYVRQWCPELAKLPAKWIHKPYKAPPLVLHGAGVTLGETYPHPIVDHSFARARALAAFEQIKLPSE